MTKFVDFRLAEPTTRLKMKIRNAEAVQKLIEAERASDCPLWVRPIDFPGCLDHFLPRRPDGAGLVFRCGNTVTKSDTRA